MKPFIENYIKKLVLEEPHEHTNTSLLRKANMYSIMHCGERLTHLEARDLNDFANKAFYKKDGKYCPRKDSKN